MPKREETLGIEAALQSMCEEKRIYGCEEITIGFCNAGRGQEVVDFATMDSKGVLKCYEIKVTLSDLKSKAKKSWYGHYNYLVVSKELYQKVEDWSEFLPDGVGLIVATKHKHDDAWGLSSAIKAKKQDIDAEQENMMKESMIRSIYLKYQKYKNVQSLEKHKQLIQKLKNSEEDTKHWQNIALDMRVEQQAYVEAYRFNHGINHDKYNKCRFRTIAREEIRQAIANGFDPYEW